jgi:hypothetical protein
MGKGSSLSLGALLLNIAVAAYLFAIGIIDLAGKKGDIRDAVGAVFSGNIVNILTIVLAVLAVAAGIFILLKLFGIKIPSLELILIILAIAWIVFIVLIDFIDAIGNKRISNHFLEWLATLGCHLMALGGLLVAAQK